MKKFIFVLSLLAVSAAHAQDAGKRDCKYTKFGLNDADEVCAVITPGKKNTILRLATDVATYDPVSPAFSRQTVAAAICKLFGLGQNVFASMSFRKAEQAGFIGGGAILGGGFKKISAIDTLRCENK